MTRAIDRLREIAGLVNGMSESELRGFAIDRFLDLRNEEFWELRENFGNWRPTCLETYLSVSRIVGGQK